MQKKLMYENSRSKMAQNEQFSYDFYYNNTITSLELLSRISKD